MSGIKPVPQDEYDYDDDDDDEMHFDKAREHPCNRTAYASVSSAS